jgi:26S proteasome regulatory subunit N1
MLRNLSSYYQKDAPGLHLVRVAQGLLHLGKGLCTINPYHSDRQLLSAVSLASLLTVLYCGSETSTILCGSHAFMIFYLAPAIRPRMLMTVDEAGDILPVSVRVGTAVDTVAQAGKPKAITGADEPQILACLLGLLHASGFPCV